MESEQDRAGSGPRRGYGPGTARSATASPRPPPRGRGWPGRAGRGQGHSDQEVGILLLGVCLGNSSSLDRVE